MYSNHSCYNVRFSIFLPIDAHRKQDVNVYSTMFQQDMKLSLQTTVIIDRLHYFFTFTFRLISNNPEIQIL